jgi:SAM-dependent methyltransferase
LLAAAEQAGSADDYQLATAANLPFADDMFDLAIAYNVLMDLEDVSSALREIGRVLRPFGTLVISIVHPFADRGRFVGSEPDAPFILQNSYFGRERFGGVEERKCLQDAFRRVVTAPGKLHGCTGKCGFAISALREPIPDANEAWTHLRHWHRIPLFLWLKARLLPI